MVIVPSNVPSSDVLHETTNSCCPSSVVILFIGVPFLSLTLNLLLSHEMLISEQVLQLRVKVLLLDWLIATGGRTRVALSLNSGVVDKSVLRVTVMLESNIFFVPNVAAVRLKRIRFVPTGRVIESELVGVVLWVVNLVVISLKLSPVSVVEY